MASSITETTRPHSQKTKEGNIAKRESSGILLFRCCPMLKVRRHKGNTKDNASPQRLGQSRPSGSFNYSGNFFSVFLSEQSVSVCLSVK